MKIQLGWLREHAATTESARQTGERLTSLGFALDGLQGEGDEAVLELDVGSNRPDALSHLGMAREVAASLGCALRTVAGGLHESSDRASDAASIAVDDLDLCPRYCARVVRGVRVGPSPPWMTSRLEACGIRPINVVVDVTNYVLLELGHPLHAFDLDLLEGRRIVVRRARAGERLTTLDGQDRPLGPDMLLIADGARGIALAGIMGGANTEIGDTTSNVLIESAVFAPASVRRTARELGLATEASQRFGRGCDPRQAPVAADRAAALLAELAGGTVLAGMIDVGAAPPLRTVSVRLPRLRALTGVDVSEAQAVDLLRRLSFGIVSHDASSITAEVPSWRNDVEEEVDLIEEIVRLNGFDEVPATLPAFREGAAPRRPWELSLRRVRESLVASGWLQALHFTFDDPAQQRSWATSVAGEASRLVELENPMAENLGAMRLSLLPALLRSLAAAVRRGEEDVRLFEEGPVFLARTAPQPRRAADDVGAPPPVTPAEERMTLALVATGLSGPRHFLHPAPPVDVLTLKGALLDALVHAGARREELTVAAASIEHCAPGAAEIRLRGQRIGWLGRIHPRELEALEVAAPVHAAEVDLTSVIALGPAPHGYVPQSRYPKTGRDLCVLVDRTLPLGVILNAVTAFRESRDDGDLIESVELLDRWLGAGVPEDKASLTFTVTYRRPDRTLTQDEVDARHQALLDALVREVGAQLRS